MRWPGQQCLWLLAITVLSFVSATGCGDQAGGQLGPFIAINPNSFIGAERQGQILNHLKHASVVFVSGGKNRKTNDGEVAERITRQWIIFTAGYGPNGNKHAGVSICLNRRWFRRKMVRTMACPKDRRLQGRVMCIRVIMNHHDFFLVVPYFPIQKQSEVSDLTHLI